MVPPAFGPKVGRTAVHIVKYLNVALPIKTDAPFKTVTVASQVSPDHVGTLQATDDTDAGDTGSEIT